MIESHQSEVIHFYRNEENTLKLVQYITGLIHTVDPLVSPYVNTVMKPDLSFPKDGFIRGRGGGSTALHYNLHA